jgi:hypothetical protein
MGADKYVQCPFCLKNAEKTLADKYGKIPQKDYEDLKTKIESGYRGETIGVYSEAYLDGDTFIIDFGATCNRCQMKWSKKVTIHPCEKR